MGSKTSGHPRHCDPCRDDGDRSGDGVAVRRAAEEVGTEAIGSLGVEFGAALWFAKAITLGALLASFKLRLILFGGLTSVGLGLIAVSLLRSWTGAGLALAMEFGVGAPAIVVIDTVLLNYVQRRLSSAATIDEALVKLRLTGAGRGVAIDAIRHDDRS